MKQERLTLKKLEAECVKNDLYFNISYNIHLEKLFYIDVWKVIGDGDIEFVYATRNHKKKLDLLKEVFKNVSLFT